MSKKFSLARLQNDVYLYVMQNARLFLVFKRKQNQMREQKMRSCYKRCFVSSRSPKQVSNFKIAWVNRKKWSIVYTPPKCSFSLLPTHFYSSVQFLQNPQNCILLLWHFKTSSVLSVPPFSSSENCCREAVLWKWRLWIFVAVHPAAGTGSSPSFSSMSL